MRKKVLALLTCVALISCLFAMPVSAAATEDKATVTIENGVLTVTNAVGGKDYPVDIYDENGNFVDTVIVTVNADGTGSEPVDLRAARPVHDIPAKPVEPSHTHSWGESWESDSTGHWHVCTADDCTAPKGEVQSHTYGNWTIDQDATTTTTGSKHRECSVCGYKETVTIPVVPPEHQHTPDGNGWYIDANYHWHVCSAPDKAVIDKAQHTYGNDDVCTVCGYKKGAISDTPVTPDIPYIPAPAESANPGPSASPAPTTPVVTDGNVTLTPTVKDGAATAELDQKTADGMVDAAVKSGSANVEVKVDAPASATSVAATIPASSAGNLASKTKADLTVSTPLADVVLSNAAVGQLAGKASKTVGVAVAKNGDKTTVSIQVDGKDAGTVSGVKANLPVAGAVTGTIVKIVNPDGTETIIKKAVVKDGNVALALTGTTTVRITKNSKSFSDTSGHWAVDAIDFVTSRELFLGTGDGSTFSPASNMSRGMLATVLHRLEDAPDTAVDSLFSDVEGDTWYTDGVAWAADNGIVNGQGDGTFAPNRDITRQELAIMLYNYAGYLKMDVDGKADLNGFADSGDVADWSSDAVRWAVKVGIISGTDTGNLLPTATATRAEVSAMIERMIKLM